jgi:hypothetical protein
MFVSDLAEKLDPVLAREERCADRVNGCITPTLVVKATMAIEIIEECCVSLAAPKVHIGNLKIAPKVAEVVVGTTIIRQKVHRAVHRNVFGMLGYEI